MATTPVAIASAGTLDKVMRGGQQHKLIWDGTYLWAFYFKSGTADTLFYAYSSDGATWTESSVSLGGTVYLDGSAMDVYFRTISSVKLVLVTYLTTPIPCRYMRGTISGTSISWGSNSVYISSNGPANPTTYPAQSITTDVDTNIVLAATQNAGGNWNSNVSTNVLSSTFADTASEAQWTPVTAALTDYPRQGIVFESGNSNEPVILYDDTSGGNPAIESARGTTIQSIETGSGVDRQQWGACMRTVANEFKVHLIYQATSNTFQHKQSGSDLTWSDKADPTWPSSGLATNSGVCLATDGTDLYLIVIRGDAAATVAYNKYTVSSDSWGGWNDAITSTKTRTYVNSMRASQPSGKLWVMWQEANGSNYDVMISDLLGGGAVVSGSLIMALCFEETGVF
jgi:hypothetical protein